MDFAEKCYDKKTDKPSVNKKKEETFEITNEN